jgi:hypothetical protein
MLRREMAAAKKNGKATKAKAQAQPKSRPSRPPLTAITHPGALLLNGPNVSFTKVDQILWHGVDKAGRSGVLRRLVER